MSGLDPVDLNDLWSWDPIVQQWTWLSGNKVGNTNGRYGTMGAASPINVPGSRMAHSMAMDSNTKKIYLFGGEGIGKSTSTSGLLNDLWEWDLVTARWSWISGSTNIGQPGVYQQLGIANSNSTPSSRRESSMVFDERRGLLFLFGGSNQGVFGMVLS